MTRDGRRLLEHFSFGKCEQLGGFYRAKEEFNGGRCGSLLSKDQGENHEICNNSISLCVRAFQHGRAGASPRTGWLRISRGAISGFVCGSVGGFDNGSPHVEEHWPRGTSA